MSYLDGIEAEHGLEEGEDECGEPLLWLLFAPLHAVDEQEEGAQQHREAHQHTGYDGEPVRQEETLKHTISHM